jgi:hypothetical protein
MFTRTRRSRGASCSDGGQRTARQRYIFSSENFPADPAHVHLFGPAREAAAKRCNFGSTQIQFWIRHTCGPAREAASNRRNFVPCRDHQWRCSSPARRETHVPCRNRHAARQVRLQYSDDRLAWDWFGPLFCCYVIANAYKAPKQGGECCACNFGVRVECLVLFCRCFPIHESYPKPPALN